MPSTPRSFSVRDLEILGYDEAKEERFGEWSIYSGVASAGLERLHTTFLYLKAGFTKEVTEKAKAEFITRKGIKYVIVPESERDASEKSLRELFGTYVKKIFVHEDLMWTKIRGTFVEYLAHIITHLPEEVPYVPPRKEGPYVRDERLDDELLQLLTDATDSGTRQINVVRADAGVGKTTLARHLTRTLADKCETLRIVPVYVEASHWKKLQLASLEGLWEIIDNSFRQYSDNLRISRSFFEHLLGQRYLAFIFDGFDELCNPRYPSFTPRSVLDDIVTLAAGPSTKTGTDFVAQIVITTRKMYWDAVVGSAKQPFRVPFRMVNLAPFNRHQAIWYFQNAFKERPKDQKRAMGIYRKLVANNTPLTAGGPRAQVVNHPFCLQMIAEGIRRGYDENFTFSGSRSLLLEFLLQFCVREGQRQELFTKADKQLDALQEIAVAGDSEAFDINLCVAAGFDERDLARIIDHPLLEAKVGPEKTLYSFRYEFLAPFLRAKFLAGAIKRIAAGNPTKNDPAWRVMSKEAGASGSVLEHMRQLIVPEYTEALAACYRAALKVLPRRAPELSFLFHVARLLIERPNLTKRERTDLLFGLLGEHFKRNREIRHLYVIGQIDKLDLTGVKFVKCEFVDVAFTDCIASKGTEFKECVFSGNFDVAGTDQKTWKNVEVKSDCILEFPTNLIWGRVLGAELGHKEEHIRDALRLALAKFWHGGQRKLTIGKDEWQAGILGHSIYCQPIRDAMLKCGVIQEISIGEAATTDYSFLEDALPDLQRFMDNGQLTGRIRCVFDALLKK